MDSKLAKEKNSFVIGFKSLAMSNAAAPPPERGFMKVQISLRILAIALTAAAMATLLTSGQSVLLMGIVFEARYYYASPFKFVLVADAIVCGCSLVSLVLVFLLSKSKSKSNPSTYFVLFLHDLVVGMLMMAGCAAGTAVGVVAREGISQVGWTPLCDEAGRFCNKMTISVALSYVVLLCYLALTFASVHKLKCQAQEGDSEVK